jgi:hypothetical protein
MNGRYGAWGQDLPVDIDPGAGTPVEELSSWQALSKALTVGEFLATSLQDKYKAMLTAERKLNNARAQGQSSAYIAQLQVNYEAARRAYQRQLDAEQSTQQYRLLGQVAAVAGIGLVASGIFFVLTRALR